MSAWSVRPPDADETRLLQRRHALQLLGALLLGCRILPAHARSAFGEGSLASVLNALEAKPAPSPDVSLVIPDFVENGAVVPVEVTTQFAGPQDIYIISESNPFPLVARFSIPEGTEPFVSTRIKVAGSCNVYAVVRSNERFYSAVKATTVTIGGCGA
jgi:sulfur-oxidizing protein SoxY